MSDVPEHYCLHWRDREPTMELDPQGEWVRSGDYRKLEAERDRLRGLLVDAPYAYAATTGKHNLRDWLCEVRAALGGDDE
jgi:hypothetical protein